MDNLETQRFLTDDGEGATLQTAAPQVEFDRYELLRELGRGGTGFVWLAHDRVLGADVALKTLRQELTSQPAALLELKREVLLNRTLSHPNIIKTFDFVTNGRASAIAMEYVQGTNLQRLRAEQPAGFSRSRTSRNGCPSSARRWSMPTASGSCTAISSRPTS